MIFEFENFQKGFASFLPNGAFIGPHGKFQIIKLLINANELGIVSPENYHSHRPRGRDFVKGFNFLYLNYRCWSYSQVVVRFIKCQHS